ncbi:hypothetical protein [Akkermansia glycaniphila]|uniref:Uncharacterized protein n=1 Tax=Akkermansia glycaniphila TaxID=1679444 RepID=A0A1C7P9B3_9BACT|nr:hypothetical protein [Akkermansia glycaniphila]OCA02161.1 hypothetical protein AC781_11405 [Akkermansia glycaniphila]SEH99646.1 Hypothetical protein PYTT_2416 [Akkermansia glycaniphila]
MFGIGRTFKKVFGDTGSKVLLGVTAGALTGGVAAGAFGATGLGIGATASTLGVSTTTAGALLGGAYGGTAALIGSRMAKMAKGPSAASLLPDDSGSTATAGTTSESSTGSADNYAARRKAGFHFGKTLL